MSQQLKQAIRSLIEAEEYEPARYECDASYWRTQATANRLTQEECSDECCRGIWNQENAIENIVVIKVAHVFNYYHSSPSLKPSESSFLAFCSVKCWMASKAFKRASNLLELLAEGGEDLAYEREELHPCRKTGAKRFGRFKHPWAETYPYGSASISNGIRMNWTLDEAVAALERTNRHRELINNVIDIDHPFLTTADAQFDKHMIGEGTRTANFVLDHYIMTERNKIKKAKDAEVVA